MQVIRPALLRAGFELVSSNNLEVTDDVSIIEALGEPVQVTQGEYTNIKVQGLDCFACAVAWHLRAMSMLSICDVLSCRSPLQTT